MKRRTVILHKELSKETYKMSFNPIEPSEVWPRCTIKQFVCTGKGILQLYYRLEENLNASKPILGLNQKDHNFIDAQFFPNRYQFVAITSERQCFIIEADTILTQFVLQDSPAVKVTFKSKEEDTKDEACFDAQLALIPNGTKDCSSTLVGTKTDAPSESTEAKKSLQVNQPVCLAVGANHFAVGWAISGKISVYELKQSQQDISKLEATLTKVLTLGEDKISIASLSFGQTEESLAIVSAQKNSVQCYLANIPQLEALQAQSLCPIKELLEKGNLAGGINAISLSFCKSHAATVGEDHVVRVWDFSDRFQFVQIITHKFLCDLFDVSLNPTATQLAIGTSEGVKIYYVIASEELKMAIDVSGKNSLAVRYSNGGHLLAAGFGSQVLIIDSATLETKYVLGPHRSMVTQVSWADTDLFMSSACKGGSIVVWGNKFELYNVADQHLLSEIESLALKAAQANNKYEFARLNVPIIGLVYDDEYDLLITLGADKVLEILSDHAANQYFYHKFDTLTPTSVHLSKELRVLFIGFSNGHVRVLLWPVKPKSLMEDYHDFPIHLTDISSIKVSHDLKHLVTTSKDGTLSVLKVFEIYDGIEGLQGSPEFKRRKGDLARIRPYEIMDSLCLTYRKGIKDKLALITKLQEDKKNISDQGKEKELLMEKTHEAEMADIISNHDQAMGSERKKYRRLQEQYEAECKRLESERHRVIEENNLCLEKMEEQNKKEQRSAFDLNNRKMIMIERQRAEFRAHVEHIQKFLKEQLGNIEATYQGKYEELRAQHNELLEKINSDGGYFDEALEQCELEYEKEIEEDKKVATVNEKKAKFKLNELQKEQETLEKEIKEVNKEILSIKDQKITIKEELYRAKQKKSVIDSKVKELEDQLKVQQAAILRKESELKEMKGKNSHLDNLKCILDHKIEALDNEKEPMEQQIKKLEDQVKKMHQDLEREAELKKKLDEELKGLKAHIRDAEEQKKQKSVEVENMRHKLLILQHDLISAVKEPIDNWEGSLAKIGSKFFVTENEAEDQPPTFDQEYFQIKDELVVQKQWLEQKLRSVKAINTLKEQEKGIAVKMMEKENTELIADSNRLRSEYEVLKCKIGSLENKYKSLKKLVATIAKGDENINKQIKRYMQPSASRAVLKTAAIGTGRKQKTAKRSVSIMNFHSKVQPEERKLLQPESRQLGKLFGTMQINKEVLEAQNREMALLQEKVSQFLLSNDENNKAKPEEEDKMESNELVSPIKPKEEREPLSASTGTRATSKRTMYSSGSSRKVPWKNMRSGLQQHFTIYTPFIQQWGNIKNAQKYGQGYRIRVTPNGCPFFLYGRKRQFGS
eukprot:TRINITY_DN4262_c3_g1_i1.p1 TRINITY_DN4262_c3_g1~~TRINITY_DN4262_c3_g1_i1.p1  ORF type:complete len:1328 (+),score=200.70 TRINITY_DN4262_c3_g1_i1:7781-11764(+)